MAGQQSLPGARWALWVIIGRVSEVILSKSGRPAFGNAQRYAYQPQKAERSKSQEATALTQDGMAKLRHEVLAGGPLK